MKKLRSFWFVLLLLVSLMGFSAPAVPTYFCNFEDGAENAEWVFFNATNVFPMTWKVGTSAHASGRQSLYTTKINELDSDTRSWAKNGGFTVSAYRKMTLTPGTYQVSLDYYSPDELISVALVQADELTNMQIKTNTGAGYASIIDVANIPGLTNLKLAYWGHASADVIVSTSAGTATYLLVVTYRSQGAAREFGAAVDNVEVVRKQTDPTACDYPIQERDLDVQLEAGLATITWSGNADQYEIGYYNGDNMLVYDIVPASGNEQERYEISLENLPEGLYHFMVRAAGTDCAKSAWAYKRNKLVYDPTLHCIDYLNFDAAGVTCSYGSADWGSSGEETHGAPIWGYVDEGYKSQYNTHTVHYVANERVAITNNQLRTVPEGSFASVRLGSREPNHDYPGSHYERISYTINITEEMGVLLFRYAYIGQTGGHDGLEQSHIRLKLKDPQGNLIGGDCGSLLFTAPRDDAQMAQMNQNPRTAGWHKGLQDPGDGSVCNEDVYWRDWTTVGVNVQEFIGQTITVEVTNYGCYASCHYGYCYFVLDCSKGEIEGQTCGNKPRELVVDDGFTYRWYVPSDPNHVFAPDQDPTSRSLDNIAQDDTVTYYCDLMRKDNPSCYFTLHAPAIKRLPRAKMLLHHTPHDCQNFVTIENQSAVYGFFTNEEGQNDSIARDDAFANYALTYQFGNEPAVTVNTTELEPIEVDPDGGLLTVTLEVQMKEGCTDTKTLRYNVPAIGPTEGYITRRIAQGDSVLVRGKFYSQPGDYLADEQTNVAGCDSSIYLHVDRLDPGELEMLYDTICRTNPTDYEGLDVYVKEDTIRSVCLKYIGKDIYADSLYQKTEYQIFDKLETHVEPMAQVCAEGDTVFIFLQNNLPEVRYSLFFNDLAHSVGFEDVIEMPGMELEKIGFALPESDPYVRPDNYEVVLLMEANDCGITIDTIPFTVSYPRSIAPQKWGNVLTLLNEEYNGGYLFMYIQWYKNGEPIPGANDVHLYLGEGETFSEDDVYTVGLIRVGETVQIMSCPLGDIAAGLEDIPLTDQLPADFLGTMKIYDVLGRVLYSGEYDQVKACQLMSEQGQRVCLIQLQSATQTKTYRLAVQ